MDAKTPPADWKELAAQLAEMDPETFGPPPGDDWQPDIAGAADTTAEVRAEVAELRQLVLARVGRRPPG